jgi:hypothetical protein
MLKKTVLRGLLGIPLGICLAYLITIGISLVAANGWYSPCPPALIEQFGSEIMAVVFQALLAGLMGAVFAGASTIWEMENWSIAKQTGIYFLVGAVAMFPIAYLNHWMEHSIGGFISYFIIFVVVFVVMWVVMRFAFRSQIKQVNEKLKSYNTTSE